MEKRDECLNKVKLPTYRAKKRHKIGEMADIGRKMADKTGEMADIRKKMAHKNGEVADIRKKMDHKQTKLAHNDSFRTKKVPQK